MDKETEQSASEEWGYKQEFPRVVQFIQSFAVGFSQISITAGIFGTLGVILVTSGGLGIWAWGVTGIGFLLVAAIYATFSSRVPLTGHGYQYVSRFSTPQIGWYIGWLTLLLTGIASMAVAYSVAAFVLPPLFGFQSTALNAAVITAGLLIIFALLTMFSTLITTRINEYAVITEIVGMLGFGLLLFIVVAFRGGLHWDYLVNSGSAASTNYFSLGLVNHGQNSPWVLAFILPLFTLFGFEGCANVAEDMKHDPRIQVPRAIFYSELTAWLAGLIFLILTITAAGNLRAVTNSSSALSFIMTEQLGGVLGRIFLIVVLYSVFACGLVLFLSTTRMVWAMSRDNRFPGSAIWQRVNSRTGTPLLAAVMVGVALLVILGVFVQQTNVWNNLLGATSLPPFLIYPIVIIVYLMNRRRLPEAKVFRLGRWDVPVAALALVWIAFGLSVFKSGFNSAWVYTGGGIVLGGVYLIWHRVRTGPMSQPSGRRQDSDAQAIETISSP